MNNLITLKFDFSKVQEQINELLSCFPEGIPNQFVGNFKSLISDIVISDFVPTVKTVKIIGYFIICRFGKGFQNFLAALRTKKGND